MSIYDMPPEMIDHIVSYLPYINAFMAKCAWKGFGINAHVHENQMCRLAAQANDIRLLSLGCAKHMYNLNALCTALIYNSTDCVHYLLSIGMTSLGNREYDIGKNATAETIKIITNPDIKLYRFDVAATINGAMSNNNYGIVMPLCKFSPECARHICSASIGRCRDALLLRFLHGAGAQFGDDALKEAVKSGNTVYLRYHISIGMSIRSWIIEFAHDLNTVKILHEHGLPLTAAHLRASIKGRTHDLTAWLVDNNCPINDAVIRSALNKSNLIVTKWLYAQKGVVMKDDHVIRIIWRDNPAMLEYFLGRGCPMPGNLYENAMRGRAKNFFVIAQRYGLVLTPELYQHALKYSWSGMFEYLHGLGCPWGDDTLMLAALEGQVYLFEYAHKNGAPGSLHDCLAALLRATNLITELSKNQLHVIAYIAKVLYAST